MKRLYSAIGLCAALLIFEAWILLPAADAKPDVINGLVQAPAPPPPNPRVPRRSGSKRPPEFFNLSKPPSDDAPIDDLLEYWANVERQRQTLTYTPDPSDRTLERLFKEIDKDPKKLEALLGSFPANERAAEFVKKVYDHEGTTGVFSKEERWTIKDWLLYNSPYFSDELLKLAQKAGDTENAYVTNQEEVLALARVDFDRARPLIDRLYASGSDKASRVLARWALYRHALDTNSLGDIERYRDELRSTVEDKSLAGPTRDLAMDALVSEKEWAGRDEWYASLLSDPTLADLNGYTGLTTLINISPAEKYVDKMIELLRSSDKAVRTAAVRNLLLRDNGSKPEVVRAMLPWLEDPNWANDVAGAREGIINALRTVKLPESVPGLIKILDEKKKTPVYMANAVNAPRAVISANRPAGNFASANATAAVESAMTAVNAAIANATANAESFAFRSAAIGALAFQADPSAGPALRRIMTEMDGYERYSIIEALIKCNGFSIPEQVDAFEYATRRQVKAEQMGAVNAPANYANSANTIVTVGSSTEYVDNSPMYKQGPLTAAEIKQVIGERLLTTTDVSDDLVYATISRIEALDARDPKIANAMRNTMLRWPNVAVNVLYLRDLKNERAETDAVIRLLALRRVVKAQLSTDVFEAKAGPPTSNGIAACLIDDVADYDAILAGDNAETKAAMLACSRLVRAQLPVGKVAELLKSGNRQLALAAERYLEAEDSPEARSIILSLHPGEVKITGATTGFFVDAERTLSPVLNQLFASVSLGPEADEIPPVNYEGEEDYHGEGEGPYRRTEPEPEDLAKTEKTLQDEIKKDGDLLGVYAYDRQYVRIYKDRVILSWDDDDSRYRERPLSKEDFDALKNYLAEQRVDELTPFLQCDDGPCVEHELLMLGRGGGRRVYTDGGKYEFFEGLDKIFADYKLGPSVIKYALSREIPNLEILLANDNLDAMTVWKEGNDMRVAATDREVRKRVEKEIDTAVETAEEKDGESEAETPPSQKLRTELTQKRAYEGVSWHSVVGGNNGGIAAQPAGFDIVPNRDNSSVPPTEEQWKARTSAFEIRASSEGIFKFAGGKLTSLLKGEFSNPLITGNGKWVLVHRPPTGVEEESSIARFNLLTNRLLPVKIEGYSQFVPAAFIPSINRVLLVEKMDIYPGEEIESYDPAPTVTDPVTADPDLSSMRLLDPETGILQDAVGEMGPLAQQTFRPLQKTGRPNEFWAAIPDIENRSTKVGIYNTNNFGFKVIMTIPKITFNSMSMWADEPGGKIYFVYRGHLLSLPLTRK